MKRLIFFLQNPFQLIAVLLGKLFPCFRFFVETVHSTNPITFKVWFVQKVLGNNKKAYWQMHPSSKVVGAQNIYAGIDSNPGMNPGCYIQGNGKLHIGDYTRVGANCGLLSGNHDLYDHTIRTTADTTIGEYCWIGMNSVVLPGVTLGDFTKVGSGSVVSKSFPDGYCVIAGNPAKVIKQLDPKKCIRHKQKIEYNGYIKASKFEAYRKKHLNF